MGREGAYSNNYSQPSSFQLEEGRLKRSDTCCGTRKSVVVGLVIAAIFVLAVYAGAIVIVFYWSGFFGPKHAASSQEIIQYDLEFRITNKEYVPSMANTSSQEFLSMADDIEKEVDAIYKSSNLSSSYKSTEVIKLSSGSIITVCLVKFKKQDGDQNDRQSMVRDTVLRTAKSDTSRFQIDPASVQVKAATTAGRRAPEDDDNDQPSRTQPTTSPKVCDPKDSSKIVSALNLPCRTQYEAVKSLADAKRYDDACSKMKEEMPCLMTETQCSEEILVQMLANNTDAIKGLVGFDVHYKCYVKPDSVVTEKPLLKECDNSVATLVEILTSQCRKEYDRLKAKADQNDENGACRELENGMPCLEMESGCTKDKLGDTLKDNSLLVKTLIGFDLYEVCFTG